MSRNNESFGITLQYAICEKFKISHNIEYSRINQDDYTKVLDSGVLDKIFSKISTPEEYLTRMRFSLGGAVKGMPHNFRLSDGSTFSVKTFTSSNRKFAPKIVGQAGDETFNHVFGHLQEEAITRDNFKAFCIEYVDSIFEIALDYALISDYTCWIYLRDNAYDFDLIERGDVPDRTFEKSDFSFTRTLEDWNESVTVKYEGKTVMEFQLHANRSGYKIRLDRLNLKEIIDKETFDPQAINSSTLGDSAELAICNVFKLPLSDDSSRLINNSNRAITSYLIGHYRENKSLFLEKPVAYGGTQKRERGGQSKSGVDFYLENNKTLSLKTNKSKSYKVCPPEVGQPSPKTFDLYFKGDGLYDGEINEEKFRDLVRCPEKVVVLLDRYVLFLNECDYILWTYFDVKEFSNTESLTVKKWGEIQFDPSKISYSNDFLSKSSVTIRYYFCNKVITLGEFQVHSARNSLKFRFNFNNLLRLIKSLEE